MNVEFINAYLPFKKRLSIIGIGISLSTIFHYVLWKVQFAYHWYAYLGLLLLFLWVFYRFYSLEQRMQAVAQKVWFSVWISFALLLFGSVCLLAFNHYTIGFSMATLIIGAYGFLQGTLVQKKVFKIFGLMGFILGILGFSLNFKTALLLLAFSSATNLVYPAFTKFSAEEKV